MAGDVQLRQLEYLVALAREQHFGRAAAACHASQSTLSTALQTLERQLDVTIVLRGRRFEGFTPEGQRVVGWAHRILAERDALHTDLDRMRDGLSAMVRIGAIPTAVPATPALTTAWIRAHPRAGSRIEVLPSREIDRRLAEFELDAGLTYLEPDEPGDTTLPLYRERYLLVTPGPTAADRETVGWADVGEVELCALVQGMQNRQILDDAVRAAGGRPRIVVETDTVAALYAHLATGRWSAVIAHTWLRAFGVPPGMRALPVVGEGPRPTVGLRLGDRGPASHVALAFRDAVAAADVAAELERAGSPGDGGPGGPRDQ
ncbi:LysR family transcriptional regulator [Pseudonocardia sp. HH130630-07]|uniref:LysR family transcriptional regulator n=1 Tax=Pseudonocardia sp. HH130630-07 TaxID=1690815 RepID=UPI000814BA55|nr:LysR family transcriptional regulator [Pseudonocardia sp. HH130630-07]ANY05500.1 LysR family transcriptional regulator [Pseudonocardia sp. HH130630-07]